MAGFRMGNTGEEEDTAEGPDWLDQVSRPSPRGRTLPSLHTCPCFRYFRGMLGCVHCLSVSELEAEFRLKQTVSCPLEWPVLQGQCPRLEPGPEIDWHTLNVSWSHQFISSNRLAATREDQLLTGSNKECLHSSLPLPRVYGGYHGSSPRITESRKSLTIKD